MHDTGLRHGVVGAEFRQVHRCCPLALRDTRLQRLLAPPNAAPCGPRSAAEAAPPVFPE